MSISPRDSTVSLLLRARGEITVSPVYDVSGAVQCLLIPACLSGARGIVGLKNDAIELIGCLKE